MKVFYSSIPTTEGETPQVLLPKVIRMEKLKEAIRKLENNFKEVIDCHSKNLESLKNFTLELNERVVAMEKTANKVHTTDLSVVKKDLTKLEGKMDSMEDKLVDGLKTTTKKQIEDRQMLQELLEDNDRKIREVDQNIQQYKNTKKKQEEQIKCDECGENFVNKIDLRTHIKRTHPKNIICNNCDKIFHESWQYEKHLESHSMVKDKKCDTCGKTFFLEWRLKQHLNVHTNPQIRNCHYYNNNKVCPFDAIGCKFKHADSKVCKNPTSCKTKLCPLKHLVS